MPRCHIYHALRVCSLIVVLTRRHFLPQDTSVDPCEDFYTYSCGKWDASATIPDDKTSWLRSWDIPSERIENEMKAAMEEDQGIVGMFYKSCMDEEAINKLGTACVPFAPLCEARGSL